MQLAYSCTHLFSDTGHLLSTAPPSSQPVRSTRGRCEVIMNSELHALHSTTWHEKYDQLDVYWWSAADVCSRPDEREHCCWPLFYRFTVRPWRSLERFPPADRVWWGWFWWWRTCWDIRWLHAGKTYVSSCHKCPAHVSVCMCHRGRVVLWYKAVTCGSIVITRLRISQWIWRNKCLYKICPFWL